MPRKTIIMLILLLTVYALINICRPSGLMAYFLPSICWALLAITTLRICGLKIQLWFNKQLSITAALISIFQILALIDAGFFMGFGRSPYSFTPIGITINLIFVSTRLLGIELSRTYLMKNGRKKPVLTLALITLLYSLISTPIIRFLTLNTPLTLTKFLGSQLLPTIAENLLASYLALLGGSIAALAYRAPLKAFHWFTPILPNLPWGAEAFLGVMAPTIGFLAASQATTPTLLRRIGIPTETKRPRRRAKTKNFLPLSWMIVSILCVLMVWSSTGLLGFRLNVIASGSMRPVLEVGDIAITVQVRADKLRVGDVIQYRKRGDPAPTMHRIIEIDRKGGAITIVTKGDANNAPDEPITLQPTRKIGRLALVIPKLGWASIYIKKAIAETWLLLSTNSALTYTTPIAIALTGSIYIIRKHKGRSARRWRNLHKRRLAI